MWTKLGTVISIIVIQFAVSFVYALFKGTQVALENVSEGFDAGAMLAFFGKMFVFGVPNVPYIFTVLWWIADVVLALCIYLLIRGD